MFPSIFLAAPVALSLVLPLSSAATPGRRASVCNGFSQFCGLSYGNVTFVGAHDSYAVGVNNLFTDQDYNVTQQLNDGIRMLQMQAHNNSGTITLCHTSCSLFNGGTLQSYLQSVKSWMNSNPNDVVTLLIVNSDKFAPSAYDTVFKAVGLDTLSYSPPSAVTTNTAWPTLGSMIDSGKRLVTFMDTGADFNSVPYIIDEFTNMWETAFDVTTTFDCSVNRSNGDTSTELFLINHFLDKIVLGQAAPDPEDANVTNGVSGTGSLGDQVQTCVAAQGRNPNFMLVDFYEFGGGSVFQVAATANGVSYDPSTPVPSPRSTGTATGSTSATSTPNGAVARFEIREFIIPAMLSVCLLGGWMAVI